MQDCTSILSPYLSPIISSSKLAQKTLLLLLSNLFLLSAGYAQKNDVTVRFDAAAKSFTESQPIGNGRLGAMLFGDPNYDRIVLNEISVFSGGPQDADRDSAYLYKKPIQDYLLRGENEKAQELLKKQFIVKGKGSGRAYGAKIKFGCYQIASDLFIDWKDKASVTTNYKRLLNVETATAFTSYTKDGSDITQEAFADFKNDIIWITIKSSKPGKLNFDIALSRKENVISNEASKKGILLYGQLPAENDPGVKFAVAAQIFNTDGSTKAAGNKIELRDASVCTFGIAIRTNYNYANGSLKTNDVRKAAETDLTKCTDKSYAQAKKLSTGIFQSYFNRCRLQMPAQDETALNTTSTVQRLINYTKGETDVQLPVLYFNFGRYLFISSSRPGLLPANLQGLWAEEYQTPWNGDYHLDINIQMCYWPADATNLSDLAQPMFQYIKNLVPNGRITAWKYYRAPGWVAHVISNPWFFTSPGEGAGWGSTMGGGAWMTTHIWEQYRYTKNKALLEQYYEVIKGAADFLQSILIEEPKNKWLVTAPSNSPENTYIMPNGFRGNTCMGPTMDMQICRHIFDAAIESAKILGKDAKWARELSQKRDRLAPNQISPRDGRLQEWLDDYIDAEPHHRHTSHLYGLYPSDEITPWETPKLVEAVVKTLDARGDESTGWATAWRVNFWARMGNGDRALKMLKGLLRPIIRNSKVVYSRGGGSYPNLLGANPPFQIDGNFGGTAGVSEMLLQSQGTAEVIRFLPALPTDVSWKQGSLKGMIARGNYKVDFTWNDYAVKDATIISQSGGTLRVLLPEGKSIYTEQGKRIKFDIEKSTGAARMNTVKGQKIIIK